MRIELQDVTHVYSPGSAFEKVALRGVSLSVEHEEVLGIVGGTGSGKSTLVQHLNLMLSPTSGTVTVDGVDTAELRKSGLRRRVGLVFQFPEQALFAGSVKEDVAFGPRRFGLGGREVQERVRESLGALGVEHLSHRAPYTLSGGEARRVAVAGVLAMRPEVLVLDEPTAGLDPLARRDLLGVIQNLKARGTAVVIVSHDLDEVSEVADRVCLLEDGRVRAVGTPAEVFYRNLSSAPTTVRVAALVREFHPDIGRPVSYKETLAALRSALGA